MGGVHYAIRRNKMDVLEYLLINQAPKDEPCESNYRPIDIAVEAKNYRAIAVRIK